MYKKSLLIDSIFRAMSKFVDFWNQLNISNHQTETLVNFSILIVLDDEFSYLFIHFLDKNTR